MTETCEKCGAELKKGAKFCQNCGNKVTDSKNETAFCPNCGANVENSENFCEECGSSLNPHDTLETKSFIEKYKIPIIIGLILIIIAAIAGCTMLLMNGDNQQEDVGTQTVEVGSTDFTIPGDYIINPSTVDVDYKYSTASFSKGWSNEFDSIYITTMLVPYNVDAQDVLASEGGVQKNMMGYDGYYTEDEGMYTFAFETGGYICVVSTTGRYVLDEITCLG